MTKIYDVNRIATFGGSTCVFYLKQTLVSASWVVSASSDGTTYFNGSDGITTDNSGAGGMNNPLAWYAIRDPNNRRMLTVQRSSASSALFGDQNWRVATFENVISGVVSGSVTSSFEPRFLSASGYVVACGSGSSTIPLFERMFETSGSFRCHTIAISESYRGVYAWYNFTSTTGSTVGRTTSLWHQEPFVTSSVVDNSPLITRIQSCFQSTYGYGTIYSSFYSYYQLHRLVGSLVAGTCYTISAYDTVSQLATTASFSTTAQLVNQSGTPTQISYTEMPANTDGTDHMIIPQYISSNSTAGNYKLNLGYSYNIRLGTRAAYSAAGRKFPDTANLTTDAYVFAGPLLIPWPENVTPTA